MKAAILRAGQMVVEELDDLSPGPGQVLVEPIACGICGSDLHTVDHAHDLVAAAVAAGVTSFTADFDPDQDLVMGHELSCRITGLGAGVSGISEGDEFAAMPYLETPYWPSGAWLQQPVSWRLQLADVAQPRGASANSEWARSGAGSADRTHGCWPPCRE